MNIDRFQELAAGFASGGLEPAEDAEFRAMIRAASSQEKAAVGGIADAAAWVSLALPRSQPSAAVRDRILRALRPPEETLDLFEFVPSTGDSGWIPLQVPGAFVKMLSFQKERGYAVVLGKLEPNSSYPAHHHQGPEQIFVLEGDLQISGVTLHPGDFHNAKPGSNHGVNHSVNGCVILAIISAEDLAGLLPK